MKLLNPIQIMIRRKLFMQMRKMDQYCPDEQSYEGRQK